MVFTSEYSFKPLSPLKTGKRKVFMNDPNSIFELCVQCWMRKYGNILLDKDLYEVKQLWKVSFQNTKSFLEIFSGHATKSYSQFASVARHFISSKWTLCAQSIEAVYPGKYTKHWSLLCVWLMQFVIVKWWIILFKAVALELHSARLVKMYCHCRGYF